MSQKIRHIGDYEALRKKSYPPLEDFVDAFYHERNGDPAPMKKYLAKCKEVKNKIPKLIKPTKEV